MKGVDALIMRKLSVLGEASRMDVLKVDKCVVIMRRRDRVPKVEKTLCTKDSESDYVLNKSRY
jgi:hypothetical protein